MPNRVTNYITYLTDPGFVLPEYQWPRWKVILAITLLIIACGGYLA